MTSPKPKRIVYTADARLDLKFAAVEGRPGKIATLSGYAMVWGTLSSDRGGYKVRLRPGSARFTPTVHALYHHDYTHVIGNTANGTLRLFPDDIGVRVEIDLPDTTSGRDVEELVEGRYVTGMSFAMTDAPEANKVVENGVNILDVTGFTCDEVTVTAIPAFADTTIDVAEDDEPEEIAPQQLSAAKNVDEVMQEHARQTAKLEAYKLSLYRL